MSLEGVPDDGTAVEWLMLRGPGASSNEEWEDQLRQCLRADLRYLRIKLTVEYLERIMRETKE